MGNRERGLHTHAGLCVPVCVNGECKERREKKKKRTKHDSYPFCVFVKNMKGRLLEFCLSSCVHVFISQNVCHMLK